MWKNAKWNSITKLIITAAVGLYAVFYLAVIVGIVAGVAGKEPFPEQAEKNRKQEQEVVTEKSPVPNKIDIDAAVANYNDGMVVMNRSGREWKKCDIRVNDGYKTRLDILKNDDTMSHDNPNFIAWDDLTKDGKRFDYATMKPEKLTMDCYDSPQTTGFFYGA